LKTRARIGASLGIENPSHGVKHPKEDVGQHASNCYRSRRNRKRHQKARNKSSETNSALPKIFQAVIWVQGNVKKPDKPKKRVPDSDACAKVKWNQKRIPQTFPSLRSMPRSCVIGRGFLCKISHVEERYPNVYFA
jgi:hypothetical protein